MTTTFDDEWLPERIELIDESQPLVDAWTKFFASIPEVTPRAGDNFQVAADAIVSPANSFGIMDGGVDLALREKLGHGVQAEVQRVIVAKHHGELPVGSAEIVETSRADWPFLIAAPTMRVPEPVDRSINAYLAFRATLLAIAHFNRSAGHRRIDSLVCCGLATGVGHMSPTRCAGQMLMAYKAMLFTPSIGRFESIETFHRELRQMP